MAGISGSALPGGVSTAKAQGGLIVTGLSKSFGKTRANDDISVRLIPGEVTALIGHNGAGKTTFLNQIVGADQAGCGEHHVRRHRPHCPPGASPAIMRDHAAGRIVPGGSDPAPGDSDGGSHSWVEVEAGTTGGSGNSRYSRFRGLG